MKSAIALAAAGLIALSVPALAQNAGAPGATGTGTGLSGSNTGTSPAPANNMDRTTGAGGGMNEGRAASPDMSNTPGDKAKPVPSTVRGDQNGQGMAKP